MSNIETDIKIGLKFLQSEFYLEEEPIGYDYPFARTNEDLEMYFSKFPLTNGIVTTVAGSGDQQLQIAKDGPKEIHVFDQNPFAIHMAKLKTAGCLALSHETFMSFFDNESYTPETYNVNQYKVIRDYLDEDCKMFWDAMYKKGKYEKNHWRLVQPGDSFANDGPNSYEREENFYKAKSNLEKISIYYYYAELFNYFGKMVKDKNFDAIFLSNIYDWLLPEKKEIFANYIKNELDKLLTDKGMIAVYSPVKNAYYQTELETEFKESFKLNDKDKVLIYRK